MKRRSLLASAFNLAGAVAALPADACDTHTHVFPDPARFPFSPQRTYTPPEASPAQLLALHRQLGVGRVVIVTPSVYGADNAATLHGLSVLGARARGVAVIDDATPFAELQRLHTAGVRGVRINLGAVEDPRPAIHRFRQTQGQIQSFPWHIQLYCPLNVLEALAGLVRSAPFPVVLDHVGAANPDAGPAQPGFAAMLQLVREGKLYVKVTHRFLDPNPAAGLRMLTTLLNGNPERVLWGTDWPHPGTPAASIGSITPSARIDDQTHLQRFRQAVSRWDSLVFSTNPARLYFS